MAYTAHHIHIFLNNLLFSLINNRNVDVAYGNWKNYVKSSFSTGIYKTLLKFTYKIPTSALYDEYCSLKTVQEQAQRTR